MKSVLVRAEQYKRQASGAEQGALNYLLGHPDAIPRLSIKQLSDLSFSSASTIVRLCRKLGFSGYRELQQALVYELAVLVHNDKRRDAVSPREPLADIIENVTARNVASLEDSRSLLEPKTVARAVEYLDAASTVLLFGIGASQLVARDAFLKFQRIDKPCCCCDDIHSQLVMARNAKPSDAAIIISYSGYTKEVVTCAKELAANKTPMIAITRFDDSPISHMATVCLYVVAMEELFRSGAMSSRISQLNTIDILYTALVNRNASENAQRLTRNRISKNLGD